MIRGRAALLVRIGAVAVAAGLAVAAAAAALGLVLARSWELEHQRQRLEALLAVTGPDLGTACFLEDRGLAERVVADLLRAPDVGGVVLRTPRGLLAHALRPGREPGPELPAWARGIPSPFAKDTEVGQLVLTPEVGEVRRRAGAAAVLAAFGALAATLAMVPALLLVLHRQVVRPLATLTRLAGRSEAGALLEPPPGHGDDAIGRLVRAVNGLVRRVADAAWRVQEAGAAAPSRPELFRSGPGGGTGVFLVRQDGALEAWTPPLPALLALPGGPPPPGTRLPALFGSAADQAEACLAECAGEGRAAAVLPLGEPDAPATRWVHLVLERTGPGWIQGAVQDATGGMAALARTNPTTASGLGQDDPHPGALHGL